MGRAYALSRQTESLLSAPGVAPSCIKATRTAPIVRRYRIAQLQQATRVTTHKRKKNEPDRCSKSPRTVYTYETTDSPTLEQAACSSSQTSFDVNTGTFGTPGLTPSHGPDGLPDEVPTFESFGESSLLHRPISHSKLGTSNTFDDSVKGSVLELANEFTDSPTLLRSLRASQIAPGETALLIIEDVTARAKPANSAK